jgi:hypothetical protein
MRSLSYDTPGIYLVTGVSTPESVLSPSIRHDLVPCHELAAG